MNPETPRKRVGVGVVATLSLCCSLVASCRVAYIGADYGSAGGSGGGGSGGAGLGGCDGLGGVCRRPGQGIKGPVLVWMGAYGKRPMKVPARAQNQAYFPGFADPVVTGCGACTCGTLNHTCTLPTTMTAYDTWPCPAGQPGTSFAAATNWDGKCDDNNPIPAPNTVQSLWVDAIDLVEHCEPAPKTPVPGPVEWQTVAVAFSNERYGQGCEELGGGWNCSPALTAPDDPPEGFHLCMMSQGDGSGFCPGPDETEFSEPYVFGQGDDVTDTRTCTDCTCTPPAVKGTCTSFLSVYQDADTSCNGPEVNPGTSISSLMSTCIQINPPGQQLGSKRATDPQYTPAPGEPGCTPGGGEMQGGVSWQLYTTFCCLPSKKSYPASNHQ